VVPKLGAVPLRALDTPMLNMFYAELLESGRADGKGGLSPTTIRSVHVAVSKALGGAIKWGRVARNGASVADAPSPARRQTDVWSPEQLRTFLKNVASERLYPMWLVFMTTGLRRGELAGLRWRDLDLDAARLTVAQTRVSVGCRVYTTTPKSDSSKRSFALDPATVKALKAWKSQQAQERLAWGPAWTDTGLVFGKADGTAYHPQRFTQMFASKAKAAKLPPIRLHDTRHSYASACLDAGVPLKVLSERLGHSSIAITADIYQHVSEKVDQDSADRASSFILKGAAR